MPFLDRLNRAYSILRVRGHHLCCVFCYLGSGATSAREYFGGG